ncbi:hypothetical protein [Streptomyces megasporus]|uniref:hypothetical protein n=1 Tax=Streptomyces megasporus TaxID=44060 RepID=UPI000995F184
MVLRALASPLPISRVTADSAYGQESRFRRPLEQYWSSRASAVRRPCPRPGSPWAVPASRACSRRPRPRHGRRSPAATARRALAAIPGRQCDCRQSPSSTTTKARFPTGCGGRRPGAASANPTRSPMPPWGATVQEPVWTAGTRWAIEECFQAAKNECGLDHCRVRHHRARCRHITLARATAAHLAALRAVTGERGGRQPRLDPAERERGPPPVVQGRPHSPTRDGSCSAPVTPATPPSTPGLAQPLPQARPPPSVTAAAVLDQRGTSLEMSTPVSPNTGAPPTR